ncbi:MAG: glycosyltransferase family 2 protein, partial [Halioglobus sp.]
MLPEFHSRLLAVMESIDSDFEIIYINDGSDDSTLQVIRGLNESSPGLGIIDLSRNFGKEAAMSAGIDHASGDAVVVIDADLQDPPEQIAQLVDRWLDGYDVVYATEKAKWNDQDWDNLYKGIEKYGIDPSSWKKIIEEFCPGREVLFIRIKA